MIISKSNKYKESNTEMIIKINHVEGRHCNGLYYLHKAHCFFNTAGVIMHMLAFNLKSTVGHTV